MNTLNSLNFGLCFLSISTAFVVGLASIESGIGQGTHMDIVLMIGGIFFIGLIAFISFYSYKAYKEKILAHDEDANQNSKKSIKSTESKKSQESDKSTDSKRKDLEECVIIIIIIEEDFTESSEDEYSYDNDDDYDEDEYSYDNDDDFFIEDIHYPFRDVDLNFIFINGFDSRVPFTNKNWSLGRIYYINEDIKGKILWVWVQIYLYYPMAVPTSYTIQCSLSEDLSAHPISKKDFVLPEYDAKKDDKNFLNRTFTIIKIEKKNRKKLRSMKKFFICLDRGSYARRKFQLNRTQKDFLVS